MPEPTLTVRDLTPHVPVTLCTSGQHLAHPGETCTEHDSRRAELRARLNEYIHAAFDLADERWITGCCLGTVGCVWPSREPEPTPVDRALSILAPHLRTVALYRPGP